MMEKLTLIKVGGKIVEEPDTLLNLLSDFSMVPGHKVLVTRRWPLCYPSCRRLGIESKM